MLKEATLYAPISELAKQIEAKTLSPVELTESYLNRSEKLGPKLNAYAKLLPDQALEQAMAQGVGKIVTLAPQFAANAAVA